MLTATGFSAKAQDTINIELKDGGFYYTASVSSKGATLRGYMIDLSIKEKKCNQSALRNLHGDLQQRMKNKVVMEDPSKALSVKIDTKPYALKRGSRLANALLALPQTFKSLKQREQVLCK